MQKLTNKNITLDSLDAWGTVTDLGSELLSGEGRIFGQMTYGTPTSAISSAYFAVTKSRFRMTYPFNEHAVVIAGSVRLTNEDTGQQWDFHQGDSWFVEQGTNVLWEIQSENFIKHYFAVVV